MNKCYNKNVKLILNCLLFLFCFLKHETQGRYDGIRSILSANC